MRPRTRRTVLLLCLLSFAAGSGAGCAWIKALFGGKKRRESRMDVLTGPLRDATTYPDLIFVVPTGGPPEENEKVRQYLMRLSQTRQKTGGDPYEIRSDTEVTEPQVKTRTLILYGSVATNRVMARFKEQFPFPMEAGAFTLGRIRYAHPQDGVIFCCPNPYNPNKKYLIVFAGNSAAALTDVNSVFHGPTDFVAFNSASKELRFGRENIYKARGLFDKTDPLRWKLDPAKIEYPYTTGW